MASASSNGADPSRTIMSNQEGSLREILKKQEAELEKHVAKYLELEEKYFEHTTGVEYESLDTGAKAAYTRKLNELDKAREELMGKTESVRKRVKMTQDLCGIANSASAKEEKHTHTKLPTLPSFRGERKDAIQDAFEFLDDCKARLDANAVSKSRWLKAILTVLSSTDRQWAAKNLAEKS